MVTKEKLIVGYFLLAQLLLSAYPSEANSNGVFLGSFSNQQYSATEDPHMEGYSVMLYREGKVVFGRFCWATSIDAPCVPIQDAMIDKTGLFNFWAKLSIGQEITKETSLQGRPAFRLVKFRGKIKDNLVAGTISIKSIYSPNTPAEIEKVSLPRVPYKGRLVTSYREWISDPLNKPMD